VRNRRTAFLAGSQWEAIMPIGLPADSTTLRKHSTWFIVYGVLLLLLGIFAILVPGLATLAVEITVGWLLLLGGVFGLVAVISSGRSAPGFWWNLITAIICVLAGLSLLTRPLSGMLTLTIIVAAYLLASGVAHVIQAIQYRTQIPSAWTWMLVSGLVDIVLALIIVSGLPSTAIWVLGLLVGINLVMTGVAVTMAAVCVRRMADAMPR
jgi:uncharacterized membrane protein HdeD (DUF308 family)